MAQKRRPIRIEEAPFVRKGKVQNAINVNGPQEQDHVRRIDSLPKRILSRQFAFVKRSALFLAKEREIMQFLIVGVGLFSICLLMGVTSYLFGVKEEVSADFGSGYSFLLAAQDDAKDFSFEEAKTNIAVAKEHFEHMEESLSVLGLLSSSAIALDGTAVSAQRLIESSILLSDAFEKLLTASANVTAFTKDFGDLSPEDLRERYQSLTGFIEFQYAYLEGAHQQIQEVLVKLEEVDVQILPRSMADKVLVLQRDLALLDQVLTEVIGVKQPLLTILGERFPKRYAILFQNADEMRATGGFLGSMMFVTLNDGWMTEQTFTDVYDIAGQVDIGLQAPPGLDALTNRFGLQDANYFPEFEETARNILWFLDQGGVTSVDGIITINTTFIEDVLRVTGPIVFEVQGESVTVDADNFTTILSVLVEAKVHATSPKVFLADFIDTFQGTVMDSDFKQFLPVLIQNIETRNILMFHRDEAIQQFLEEQHLTGALHEPLEKEDVLRIVPTSISGNKSDKYISQQVRHTTEIIDGGYVINQLLIRRSHGWSSERAQYIQALASRLDVSLSPKLREILGAGINRNYTRVYVPAGSVLVPKEGVEQGGEVDTHQEGAFTVFSFTQVTEAGDTSEMRLVYRLPFQLSGRDRYSFYAEKSSGDRAYEFQKEFLNFNGLMTEMISVDEVKQGRGEVLFSTMLRDAARYFALVHL